MDDVTKSQTKGVTTVYSRIGDVFAWLCIAGFIALLGWVAVLGRKQRVT